VGWGVVQVVELFMCEALGSIPNIQKQNKQIKKKQISRRMDSILSRSPTTPTFRASRGTTEHGA
jgi:hypothetical protein